MRIRKLHLVLVLALAALLLAACGGNASSSGSGPVTGDPAKGQTKYAGTCAACHGPEGKGIPGLGKDMTMSEFIQGQSDADLIAFIKKGRSISDPLNTTGVEMPAKGGNAALTDQDLADIVAFIRSLQK